MRISEVSIAILLTVCPAVFASNDLGLIRAAQQTDATEELVEAFLATHRVKRYRLVSVDVESLRKEITEFASPVSRENPPPIEFQLFPDVVASLYTFKISAEPLQYWWWTGIDKVGGDLSETGTLSIDFAGYIKGNFFVSGETFRVERLGRTDVHIIWTSMPFTRRID